jgi:asparagine synthase (glutamine-hydrolysing)
VADQPTLHAISTIELANFIGERLLRDTDATSMAVSLEARVPLLDHQVVEAAAGLPEDVRYMPIGKKMILRKLALADSGVDQTLFDRPKSGFVLPIELWAKQELREEVERTLCHPEYGAACGLNSETVKLLWKAFVSGAPGLYWSRVWSIFVLLRWCRQQRVSI